MEINFNAKLENHDGLPITKKIKDVESDYTLGDLVATCLNYPQEKGATAEAIHRKGLIIYKIRNNNFNMTSEEVVAIKEGLVEAGAAPYLYYQAIDIIEPVVVTTGKPVPAVNVD